LSQPGNLGELVLSAAQRYGQRVAFQIRRGFRTQRVTSADMGRQARRIAWWLQSKGLGPGDRVVVWSPNMPEYALLFLGAWLAGVVVVPIDVRTLPEVRDLFTADSGARLGFKGHLLEGAFGPPVSETIELETLLDRLEDPPLGWTPPEVGRGQLAEIAYTSGTTGVPKGVMLTHENLLAEVEALTVAFPLYPSYRALSLLPLSHIYEQAVDLLLVVNAGVPMTYLPRINSATVLRALSEEHITCFVLVPEVLRVILEGIERRVEQRGALDRWRRAQSVAGHLPYPLRRLLFRQVHGALGERLIFIGCASAPLNLKLGSAWERLGVRIFEAYGLTEVSGAATINSWRAHRLGSVGRPLPGVQVRIAGGGEIGEILVKGPTVTPGYFNDPELTARSIVDGWFHTGDVGFFDAEGFLHVSGRETFRIVLPDGRKVYPEDVERMLNAHPLVRESCVVGLNVEGEETVHAVLLTDAPERAADIVHDANRRLAPHQQIATSSVWPEADFPRTPILKIDRKQVSARLSPERPFRPPSRRETAVAPADPLLSLLSRIAAVAVPEIHESSRLQDDLHLDSIDRLEVLAGIEEDLGVLVPELEVAPETTVAGLRSMVAAGGTSISPRSPARWQRAAWARGVRRGLLWLGFRIQDHWMRMEVVHPERAWRLPLPSILIFNYQGPYAPLCILRALPPHVRRRVAVAADSRLWKGGPRWQGPLAALAGQAFPFAKSGGEAVRASLVELGRWLDDGYAVIVSPEGNPELDGELLPFLGGTGLMAVEMQVPVLPFRLEGYHLLFPPPGLRWPYLPNRRGAFRIVIGEPLTFPRTMSHQQASRLMQKALVGTR
jgi:long-chain acyl-CoA synthetase